MSDEVIMVVVFGPSLFSAFHTRRRGRYVLTLMRWPSEWTVCQLAKMWNVATGAPWLIGRWGPACSIVIYRNQYSRTEREDARYLYAVQW